MALGFDLGGTQVRAALVAEGRILHRAALLTDVAGGPDAVMRQCLALRDEVCGIAGDGALVAAGIAAPGPLDSTAGIVLSIPTLPGWEGFPLRERLAQALDLPVTVENDGIAAAYGEWRHGAGTGLANLVYVTVSTGIGGGVVADNRLLRGHRGMAGHVGHARVSLDGPRCACGTIGCFEALASGTALGRRAREALVAAGSGFLAEAAAHGPVTARHVVEGARLADPTCLSLVQEEARLLGIGFVSLAHLYSPERIIVGGGVAQAFDLMSGTIHAIIRRDALLPFKDITVIPARLGDNCGLLGIAELAIEAAT